MAKKLSPDDVSEILTSGDSDQLIGAIEDQNLECKPPYRLEEDSRKQQLAKDVSGLANAEGGHILLGVRTKKDPSYHGDKITSFSPFLEIVVDPHQYSQVIDEWVYPRLLGLKIQWFPSSSDRKKGLVSIHVPNQPPVNHPWLVTKTIVESKKVSGRIFSYYERKRSHTEPMKVEEFHGLLKDGRRFDRELKKIREDLQELPLRLESGSPANEKPFLAESLRHRVQEALAQTDLANSPAFVLAAYPTEKIEFPLIFRGSDSKVRQLLERPPELRRAGFDLGTDVRAEVVRGEYLQAVVPGYKGLHLWRDGPLVFGTKGDGNLCWGTKALNSNGLRINQLVLVETAYLFVSLAQAIFEEANPRPQELIYQLELRNMTINKAKCQLVPGPLGGAILPYSVKTAPNSDVVTTTGPLRLGDRTGRIAYLLIRDVYTWFGFDETAIPYVAQENGLEIISQEVIKALG